MGTVNIIRKKRYKKCINRLNLFQAIASDPSLVTVGQLYIHVIAKLFLNFYCCSGMDDKELAATFPWFAFAGHNTAFDNSLFVMIDERVVTDSQ
jgi:hypothetical protein